MRSPWVILAQIGLVACEGRSCASGTNGANKTNENISAQPTCAALPIRLGGAEGFVDCVKGEPSQYEYPECYTIWFDFIPGQKGVCPPEQLLMWVTGWPRVADRYEVQLRAEPATATTALILVRQPEGPVGPRGPAPGHPGEVLGRIRTVDGRFTEMLPNRNIRAYQRDITLARREL
jgi:hypothetical protein